VQPTLQIVIRVQPLVHDAIHTLAIVVADRRVAPKSVPLLRALCWAAITLKTSLLMT
jgi:hypothetical protein